MCPPIRIPQPILLAMLVACIGQALPAAGGEPQSESAPYARWANGPSSGDDFFPIAVWLQAPRNAAKYKAIGINLYVGLWKGPTAEQLDELQRHTMPVICAQNQYALAHRDRKIIVGWMHGDEPDNAQPLGRGRGYGPPIAPERIVADYKRIKGNDATRPVLLNLGQGVAWDGWHGRGVRTNHPEDYPQYVQGSDIVSFDIYPVVHDKTAVAGKLWYVPLGVSRLRKWTNDKKPVWNCIECTRISNRHVQPTPQQVKAEVWMSIIHGSKGLIYFCHQFQPRFIEAALLADDEMSAAVRAINRQIQDLAPVLNSPTLHDGVHVESEPAKVSHELARNLGPAPIAVMCKRHGNVRYVFAVRMEPTPAKATFTLRGGPATATVQVLGEDRTLQVRQGEFQDRFPPHGVRLYRIGQRPGRGT